MQDYGLQLTPILDLGLVERVFCWVIENPKHPLHHQKVYQDIFETHDEVNLSFKYEAGLI
jgi:hypothetical protein